MGKFKVTKPVYSYASNISFGSYKRNKWFGEVWSEEWKQYHITVKERFSIVLALELWSDQIKSMYYLAL